MTRRPLLAAVAATALLLAAACTSMPGKTPGSTTPTGTNPPAAVQGSNPVTPPRPPAPPPAVAPAPPPAAPAAATYTVRPGDTLSRIAAAHGLSWPSLCAANRLPDCNLIDPGQVLTLTGSGFVASNVGRKPVSRQVTAPRTAARAPVVRRIVAPAGSPAGYCTQAIAYLTAHAAPGFTFTCAPHASEPPCASVASDAVGCTSAVTSAGVTTGHIYIDSNCPSATTYENEASNSNRAAGLNDAPVDPLGGARC